MTTISTKLPEEFIRRIRKLLGEEESALFLSSVTWTQEDTDMAAHKALRLNNLKDNTVALLRILPQEWSLRPVPWTDNGFYYDSAMRPGKHPMHEMGLYYIQEPSAMAPAALSGTCPGERVLDLCAAPGGKSTQLAAMQKGRGLLVSNEIHPARAKILSQNIERMGIVNAVVTNESPERLAAVFPFYFDRIIVDAPCSGEGMFRKEEQALAMWSVDNIRTCAVRQAGILDAAAAMLRAGGTMVYSTCTFAREENEENIEAFLLRHPEFTLVDLPEKLGASMKEWGFSHGAAPEEEGHDPGAPETGMESADADAKSAGTDVLREIAAMCRDRTIRLWPHRLEGEGHFLAVLKKDGKKDCAEEGCTSSHETGGTMPADTDSVAGSLRQADRMSSRQKREHGGSRDRKSGGKGKSGGDGHDAVSLYRTFEEEYLKGSPVMDDSGEADTGHEFVLFGDELYLLPQGIRTEGLRILRAGLHLGSVKKDRFEPAHALARALGPADVKYAYELASKGQQTDKDDKAPGEDALRLAAAYLRGESLACDPSLKGWTLITMCGYSLGWAKASGGMLKNHYPKGLRWQIW